MPKLTKIVAQTSNSSRVSLYADGKFLTGLDRFTWLQLNLKSGDELTPKLIAQLKLEDISGKCYEKALKLLSLRPQSSFELRQKLSKRFSPDVINPTFVRLTKEGLLNDERFSAIWIKERLQVRQRSRAHLIAELRQKGIERSVIQASLAGLGREEEVATAVALIRRRNSTPEKTRAYLARRGFSYSVIKAAELQAKQSSDPGLVEA